MCQPNRPPSPARSEEVDLPLELLSDDDVSETSSDAFPRYTPEEFGAIFLDFYQFLATLHYKPEDLKVPPPEGWGDKVHRHGRSDYALEVLRRLPYFSRNEEEVTAIHYKSSLLDYTTHPPDEMPGACFDPAEDYFDFMRADHAVDPADVIYIATGYESGGRQFLLDVHRGEMSEDIIRCDVVGGVDVQEFFDKLKEEYRSLRIIPYAGCVSLEAERLPECEEEITEAEICAQSGGWGSDLDAQYVRQLYRSYGWPDAFRREEAFKAMEGLFESMRKAGRDDWWECQDR